MERFGNLKSDSNPKNKEVSQSLESSLTSKAEQGHTQVPCKRFPFISIRLKAHLTLLLFDAKSFGPKKLVSKKNLGEKFDLKMFCP